MGDNQRNIAQFQPSLNPFSGGDPPRSDGNSAASNIPAAAVAAAAMGGPGLWNELNRAMHYNNIQHAAAAAAAYNNTAGSGMWNQLQAQGENSRYFNSNFDRENESSNSPAIPRRIPSKGETKATPPLPPLSPHQIGGEMYRTLLAHQYDQYMAALAANLPTTHPASPSPPSHRSLPPPTHSPSSPVPTPRFSPQSQQNQAAAFLAVVAAATNRGHSSSLINGGDRLVSMPQISPSGGPSHLTSSPSPSPLSGGEGSDADERSKHRRKQGQPRRQNVSSLPSDGSPTLPSDDSGSNRKSSPSANSLPSPPLAHDALLPLRHQGDMPISQAMSHALAHPFLAAHLNPPSTPNHSNRNSPNLSNHSPLNSPKKSHSKGDIVSDVMQALSGSSNSISKKSYNMQINNNSKVHGSLQTDLHVNPQNIGDKVDSNRSSEVANNPSHLIDIGNSLPTGTNSHCRDDTSPLPTTPGSSCSVDSEPLRTSNLSKIEQNRTVSPLPSSPVVRNTSNGPFPRFAATPREVPVDLGSGPSTQFVEEDNIDIACNNNKLFNNKHSGSNTKTPAQKKSLSPLKTINLAALDNLYEDNDASSEKDTSVEAPSKSNMNEKTSVCNDIVSGVEKPLITNDVPKTSDESASSLNRKNDPLKKKIGTAANKLLRNKSRAHNLNASNLNEMINNCTDTHPVDSVVNGVGEQISTHSKVADNEGSLVNGDSHAILSPTDSMKKSKKPKGPKESLSSPDSLEDGLEGADTRRKTRQKRAVSYVEDATDPVLETREDGLGPFSPGLISPVRKRGRKNKFADFPSEGLADALSPSSTATSDSFKDSLSPERESVSLVSPPGGRVRKGRGRGKPSSNHSGDTSPRKEPISSPASDESKIYDFLDPLPSNDNITSPNSRGKRGRGRKRGSHKTNDRRRAVNNLSDNLSEKNQPDDVLNNKTNLTVNEDDCDNYVKTSDLDMNSKQSFPFLTVKDPSVLLEKYVNNSENIESFPQVSNYNPCLVNSHENDSSGDGFPPSVAATDEVQKEDEAPPSIQYIPRMGRNRDSTMNSSRLASSKERNAIEQVLLTLDKNIDDLRNSNETEDKQKTSDDSSKATSIQSNTVESSNDKNGNESNGNALKESTETKESSNTRNSMNDSHSAAVQNLQLKSKGRKKEYPMEMNATILAEKGSVESVNQPSVVQTNKSQNIANVDCIEKDMEIGNENVPYQNYSSYATSIAEAVMRSGGRRNSSGKSNSHSSNQEGYTNASEDSSSSSSSAIPSNITSNGSTPTKGRRSSRRNSQKCNEPEVVQVEIHPEPQFYLSSHDHSGFTGEQRKLDDTKGLNNHKINICAKLRERISNPPQNNMDDITVVSDVEQGIELRSRNTVNSSSERVAPSRCSKVTTPKSPKGFKASFNDRKRANSSSKSQKTNSCKKLKLDISNDNRTDTSNSDIKVSVPENKSEIMLTDNPSITESEPSKNNLPVPIEEQSTPMEEDKVTAECSSSNDAQTSGNAGDRSLRPKRTIKPPQTEEQINEVLMLLNMDSEESEDEDYVPKQMTVDSDQSLGESDDTASSCESEEENILKKNDIPNSGEDEPVDNRAKKNSQKRLSKTGSKRKKQSKMDSKLLNKNGCDSNKRKCVIEKRLGVSDENVADRSPFVQLIPSSGGEYINNDPTVRVHQPQPLKSSLIHFHTELDSKSKAASRVGFNSTLHTNYDAFSKDLTRCCSICKKFSHSNQLGDLFGPLYISGLELVKKNCQTVVDGQAQSDGRDAESSSHPKGRKRGGTIKHEANSSSPTVSNADKKEDGSSSPPWRFVPTATPARILNRVGVNTPDRCSLSSMSSKIVTRLDLPAGGITIGPGGTSNWPEKISVKKAESSNYCAEESQSIPESRGTETWIHEACLVWLPGVNVVNSRLRGIEESIILAQTNLCSICGETGGCISCLVNGCKHLVHYSCAEGRGWSLNTETFLSYCNNHKNRKALHSEGGCSISDRDQSTSLYEESVSLSGANNAAT